MEVRRQVDQSQFTVFNAALSLLENLHDQENQQYKDAINHLIMLSDSESGESSSKIDQSSINIFINKFIRKESRHFGEEGFDLRVIKKYLGNAVSQENYLLRSEKFEYNESRQLINIVSKVINHFNLGKLAVEFKNNYFDQVDLIPSEKYTYPEHKSGEINPPETRYPSWLTAMNSKAALRNDIPRPEGTFAPRTEFKLVPKYKMNPRLPLYCIFQHTPASIKYQIGKKEHATEIAEIISTEELLKLKKNKHASKTPGPVCLSSFPIVSANNPDIQTLSDLIDNLKVVSVVTVEEKVIAEMVYETEKKALPSDWLKHNVAVGLVQCPDLHTMPLNQTVLAAQYLFREMLACLPIIENMEYTQLIGDLINCRLQDDDTGYLQKNKTKFSFGHFFHSGLDLITDKHQGNDTVILLQVIDALKWDNKFKDQDYDREGRVLIHCKAGMSRSATVLLTAYIMFIDVILRWHSNSFIKEEKDRQFFGAIVKAIFYPHNDSDDIKNIVNIFSQNYRPIHPIPGQIDVLMKIIQYKRDTLKKERECIASVKHNVGLEDNCNSDQSKKLAL